MAQQSMRRGRENQFGPTCNQHAILIWTRPSNSHTGPRLPDCRNRGRTDGCTPTTRTDIFMKISLALTGASTDGPISALPTNRYDRQPCSEEEPLRDYGGF